MNETVTDWGPLPLRLFLIALVVPGSNKLLNYGSQVEFFTELGIPAPEIMVPFVGTLQLIAAALIGLGIAGRLGALSIVPVMIVAMATAGIDGLNTTTLLACLGIVALGTGRYTLRTDRELFESVFGQSGPSSGTASTNTE